MRKSLIVVLGIVFAMSLMTTAFAKGMKGSSTGKHTHMTGTVTPGTGMTGTPGTGMTGTGTGMTGTGTGMMGTITTP